jgi:tRNA U34 2-thiouridine synthase MnmA/TrmU
LDSALAVKAIQKQGLAVLAINFLIPFLHSVRSVKLKRKENEISNGVKRIAEQPGCEFETVTLADDYLKMLESPKHGYGKNLNPCIDCKILMLKQAKRIMVGAGASFVATGEVLGQRPMSQHKQSLQRIEKESGLSGLLVRPLSALLLPVTIPQERGWLKEEFLFDIQGRARKRQISLAREWGIEDYPWPGGGCLLTDPHFCRRLKDLLKYGKLSVKAIELLKLGRHFRVSADFKLVVGRDEAENQRLVSLACGRDLLFEPKSLAGPTGIGRGVANQKQKSIAAGIIARYTRSDSKVEVVCRTVSGKNRETRFIKGMGKKQLDRLIL